MCSHSPFTWNPYDDPKTWLGPFGKGCSPKLAGVTGTTKRCPCFLSPLGLPCDSAVKASGHNAGDLGSIPGLGRSPGEGKGYPLQYSGLENSMDCVVPGVAKSCTWLSNFHFHSPFSLFLFFFSLNFFFLFLKIFFSHLFLLVGG